MPVPEKQRRAIVRLVLVGFWLLIFEGSLRKWVVPQYSQYIYFIRDPLALCVYFVALRAGVFRQQSALLHVGLVLGVIATLLAVAILFAGGQYTPLLAIYGLRNYFLYIPMAFVIGRCFTAEDLRAMARHGLFAIMIAAPLCVLQFNAPAGHPLNVGIATDSGLQFDNLTSGGGKVRPAGTFTSAVGMSQLIPLCVVYLMWALTSSRKPKPIGLWLAVPGALATATALAMSGSRTSFVYAVLVMLAGLIVAPLSRGAGGKARSLITPIVLIVAFSALFPVVFPEAFDSFSSRWADAAANEGQASQLGWAMRTVHGFYDFFRLMGDMPIFGYGVGMAGNGAAMNGVTFNGVLVSKIAEEDWSRHVVELGPLLALAFIIYRVSFGVSLGLNAWRATRQSGESLPLMLFVYAAVPLVQGQITGHGLVNGFGWLFVGVCMAASRSLAVKEPSLAEASEAGAQVVAPSLSFPNLMR